MLLSSLLRIASSLLLSTVALADSVPPRIPAAEQHPLVVIEQHRASMVQRIVADWTDVIATLPKKTDVTAVEPRDVLERLVRMPIAKWRFLKESDATRHVGPMAQDFHASFGLGDDDKSIAGVDADGVAFAAIQGLNAKLEERDSLLHEELTGRNGEIAELRSELARLRRTVDMLMARTSGERTAVDGADRPSPN